MTATIRTESGVMVEPRLKDVVEAFWTKCTIEMIGSARLKLKPVDADFDLMVVNPDECELLHRPFAVGDKLLAVYPESDDCVYMRFTYESDKQFAAIKQFLDDYAMKIIHADPALRDHSTYVRSDST